MSTAVVGLLGVIAGAVVTGGIQAVGAYFSRRRHMRVAARALWANAIEARGTVNSALKNRDIFVFDWQRFEVAWAEHRDSLALALGTLDFMQVSAFFLIVRQIDDFKQLALKEQTSDSKLDFLPGESGLKAASDIAPDVLALLWRASFTFLERQNGDHLRPVLADRDAE